MTDMLALMRDFDAQVAKAAAVRRKTRQRRSGASVWGRTHKGKALAVHPDQVAEFNEAAKAAGTGAYYDPQGHLCADSEGAMQREYARRGFYDKNAGCRDQSYRGYKQFEESCLDDAHVLVGEMSRGNL